MLVVVMHWLAPPALGVTAALLVASLVVGGGACAAGSDATDGEVAAGGNGGGGGTDLVGDPYLTGTVLAPEGSIPISGALVYLTQEAPEPIPAQAYCDTCVELDPGVRYTLTGADGSFLLPIPYAGQWKLVVQKGAFRRVRNVEVGSDTQEVDVSMTTLPGAADAAAGDTIPRMAVAGGGFDRIEDTLAKLGLGEVDGFGRLVEGTERFDLYKLSTALGTAEKLLLEKERLAQYHVVFLPCDIGWHDLYLEQPEVLQNLRDYVAAGGRLYTTDFAYDVLRRAFEEEEPIRWRDDDGTFGSAETAQSYDAPALIDDGGLGAWLGAQEIDEFAVEDSWSVVASVHDYQAPDETGQTVSFSPRVWVRGQVDDVGAQPATVSFQYGCGRALFSTYHTEGHGGLNLMPQERALLYIVLEVAVCIGEIEPPK